MPSLLVRPHLTAVRSISRASKRSNIRRNPQRQQSSFMSPSPSPNPKNTPESEAQTQVTAHSEPPIRQQGRGQVRAEAKIEDPIPVPSVVPPLLFWQRLGPLTRVGETYARAQRARPWATQVASALVIYLCGDLAAQRISSGGQDKVDNNLKGIANGVDENDGTKEKGRKHDWARTARSLAIGATAAIPGYIWFTFLSRSFNYSSRVISIGIKVVVNQLMFAPLLNAYFFGAQALLLGDTLAAASRRVVNTVPVSWVNSCKFWPAVTAFTFAFVPFEYRSIFGGTIAVGWQTYLSFLNGRAERLEALRRTEHAAFGTGQLRAGPLDEKSSVIAGMKMQELPGKQAIMG
ncbi:hypothetical protein E0Z10_g5077 [Xylaria hypoxylon]|uniref:Mpv17/PMP22 family protein n=1 Tax=Xylaria hypoxylon TaxID=37992 RepID=A0A4Z0YWW3_9PEZI|nr:hypothetical protein E0Z10_g5077 [Xylaria hypoxylon]